NFQFGTQVGWLIKNGRRTTLVRNPTYTGITPRFWAGCDAIADASAWVQWGVPNCGKGEPMQTGHVGHGASPARFRNVQVGVGRWAGRSAGDPRSRGAESGWGADAGGERDVARVVRKCRGNHGRGSIDARRGSPSGDCRLGWRRPHRQRSLLD